MNNSLAISLAAILGLIVTATSSSARAQDKYAGHIRTTEALPPEEEQKGFHLPPGFEIQLVAAEPDLQKPLNLAFDAKGRLWVSGSTEYPYAAPLDKPGRDTIKILEDTNGDGRADKITTFADGLNIPIGLYPYRNGVIAYSIPYIYFLEDVDGDDHVDKRHILYGPWDYTRDLHGMNNAFRRGFDGWIYACHGYGNHDTIAGSDGHSIHMEGGNTFRMRTDGSRLELFAFGQVNPYGMVMDPRGDLFSADCHTKPIMLLLRGGHYEGYLKSHDGLGFVPHVMDHLHSSTAIAGTTAYSAENFPPEYRGNMFAGNAVTSRVNRDSLSVAGSSIRAQEQPDFVISDDLWFRPVDLQVGPDGALYIADFYNRIIGHYEVPFDHPGRDRDRGRIWRVVYTGDAKDTPRHTHAPNLATANADQLVSALGDANLTVRRLASDELSDRIGAPATDLLRKTAAESVASTARVHSLWALFRIGQLTPVDLLKAAADPEPLVRNHAMRMLSETKLLSSELSASLIAGLRDSDAFVRRAAADAISQHVELDAVVPLVDLISSTQLTDVHLRHMARIALRNQCAVGGRLTALQSASPEQLAVIADIVPGIASEEAAKFLVACLDRLPGDRQKWPEFIRHAVRQLPADGLEALIALVHKKTTGDPEMAVNLFMVLDDGLKGRGLPAPQSFVDWGAQAAEEMLDSVKKEGMEGWQATSNSPKGATMWPSEPRFIMDGVSAPFLSSLPLGEQYTGVLKSKPFDLPPTLSFFVSGHLGHPAQPPLAQSMVRLKLETTNQVIAETLPPRSDTAQRVEWNLQSYAGQKGYLEIVDGVDLSSFGWIAVGQFNPAVVRLPNGTADTIRQHAASLIGRLKLPSLSAKLKEILLDDFINVKTRAAVAQALVAVRPQAELASLSEYLAHPLVPAQLCNRMCGAIATENVDEARAVLAELMRVAPEQLQIDLALKLAEQTGSAETLLSLVERGAAPARLLQNATLAQKLRVVAPPNVAQRIDALIANLPPQSEQVRQLIAERQRDFSTSRASVGHGRELFAKHCSGCHRLRGQGALVGPQLDGIGNRGVNRIMEDVLDPSRNVESGFHTTVFALEDGRVLSGLFRRNEGGTTIMVDNTGKEIVFPTDQIAEQKKTTTSLMPENVGTTLPPPDFNDVIAFLAAEQEKSGPIGWIAVNVDPKFRSEGVTVADINRDGKQDIVVGDLWYEGPDWRPHEIRPVGDYGNGINSYSKCFLCFTEDVNGDAWPDVIVVSFPGGNPCHWYENPQGKETHWAEHVLHTTSHNESPMMVDLFGDGHKVLIMGKDSPAQMAWFEPGPDPTQPWQAHPIGPEVPSGWIFGHGLGVGDMNNDNRLDVLCTNGWWEQPATREAAWIFHQTPLGDACGNMCVLDISGDGVADVVTSSAHNYGIWGFVQHSENGNSTFAKTDLIPHLFSQSHALHARDFDGDGVLDLVTGKRWWAHGPAGDPGSDEPAVLYWFQGQKNTDGSLKFVPWLIHRDSGIGTQFHVADVNLDGQLDIITSNKKGVFYFQQARPNASASQ